MSTQDALTTIVERTTEAVESVLSSFGVEPERHTVVYGSAERPLNSELLPLPGVLSEVSYTQGVSGGTTFAMSAAGAKRLTAAMMGMDPTAEIDTEPLTEIEVSAVSEATNQMLAAAAAAATNLLGYEVDISPPDTRQLDNADDVNLVRGDAAGSAAVPLTLWGERAALVLSVPTAFLVRVSSALDELEEPSDETEQDDTLVPLVAAAISQARVPVRVELGRTRLPLGEAAHLPPGRTIVLDQYTEQPLYIYAGELLYATGHLLEVDGEWSVRIDKLVSSHPYNTPNPQGATEV